jgi:poly(A) polymerase
LSKAEVRQLVQLRDAASGSATTIELSYRLGRELARSACLLRAALLEQPVSPELETDLTRGADAVFPIVAADLMPDLSGGALGTALKQLEQAWITSGFTLGRAELLQQLK